MSGFGESQHERVVETGADGRVRRRTSWVALAHPSSLLPRTEKAMVACWSHTDGEESTRTGRSAFGHPADDYHAGFVGERNTDVNSLNPFRAKPRRRARSGASSHSTWMRKRPTASATIDPSRKTENSGSGSKGSPPDLSSRVAARSPMSADQVARFRRERIRGRVRVYLSRPMNRARTQASSSSLATRVFLATVDQRRL